MTFGQRLAAARRGANITQENFARALGDHAYARLGVAVGKSLANGALPLAPKESFSATAIQPLIDHVRQAAPICLRPLAALLASFLSALL